VKRPETLLAFAVLAASALAAGASDVPLDAVARLRAGNARFVANPAAQLPIDEARRQEQAKGQAPFAIVLSCADSRVPPEVIFNAGLGELFIVRTAGSVPDKAVLASIEYALEHLHTPALVVMGHESCGAVKAAIESAPGAPAPGPNLEYLLKSIQPAFGRMAGDADLAHLREAILANIEQVVNDLLGKSEIVRQAVAEGHLAVVGAFYELTTGRVRFSEPVGTLPAPHSSPAHP
jgi:carbonic anhydrase